MKKIVLHFAALVCCVFSYAQNASVTWGEEFKLKRGSTDLEVIYADNTGVFVKESHMAMKSYFVIGATARESATLIKLDKNLAEEYRQDFNKELKGKEYERFFFLKDKLFILATDYSKKEKRLTLFAAPVDKKSGELSGEWQEVTSWQKEEKGDDINFNATYNSDSTKMVTVSSIEGRDQNNYEVRQFDENLKQVGKPVVITNEFDPKTFQLEDVLYTGNGNVVMIGRIYEFEEGKKKKARFLQFRNYDIRIHNSDGALVKVINTAISAKWLISTKVVQLPGKEMILAAFYSNEKKGREVNGMLVQRINPVTGEEISTSLKEISTGLITKLEEDDEDDSDEESKKERKERKKLEKIQDEEDGFSRYMRFRNFINTSDSGIVILAEKFHHYEYSTTTTQYSGAGMGNSFRTTTTYYQVYECGDLMMSKMDVKGDISWLRVLPKQQKEVIQTGSRSGYGTGLSFNMGNDFFSNGFNRPFYAGFGVLPGDQFLTIIFNDHKKNGDVLELGQKVKRINYFAKSECYGVKLDAITGKYTRNILFSNDEVPTAMPRLGAALGKNLYIVGKEDRILGKTKIAIARISLKN